MSKLIKLSTFRAKYFEKGEAPTVATIRRLVESGELKGMKLGGQYYIDASSFQPVVNDLVRSVLAS